MSSTNNTPTNNHSCYSHLSNAEFITKFEHITDPIFMEALARLEKLEGASITTCCSSCDDFDTCGIKCEVNLNV